MSLLLLWVTASSVVSAFQPFLHPHPSRHHHCCSHHQGISLKPKRAEARETRQSGSCLAAADPKKGRLEESVRNKLVTESIAPWRTLRLFLYFSLGSGALVGGLITLTGTAALLSGAREGDVNTEVRSLFCFRSTDSESQSVE